MASRPKSSSTSSSRPTSRTHGKTSVPTQGRNAAAIATDSSKRQIVGQYMLGKTIGEGTFGKVKLAVHMPTGEKVSRRIILRSTKACNNTKNIIIHNDFCRLQ